ncbi:hypothetical protein O9H85_19330 [Paenibacillus filicis]|uniref:DUF5666 domain-containing protein n=1 Tax=Paenibacillus gyeongsangnamensis TaxID=3388067 RepID=A0ABT4QCI3_9BACL|nr:hypothetical protein [Paenibacillus filicis]MCZ8514535.1 hypothetical protein [Paenibacillus filicis]
MKKGTKVVCLLIAGLLGFGIVYGTGFLGDQTVSAETSTEVTGSFVGLLDTNKTIKINGDGAEKTYPLSADVWVYRNSQKAALKDLKPGDKLSIILNSKNQAAYIKASGAEDSSAAGQGGAGTAPAAPAAAAPVPAPANPPATGQSAQTQPKATQPAPSPQPGTAPGSPDAVNTPAQPASAAGGGWLWEKLSVELKGRDLQLRIKQEPGGKPGASEFYLQNKDASVIRLTGAEAEQVIALLLQNLPGNPKEFEQGLKQRLAAELKVKDIGPEWKLDVKWKEGGAASGIGTQPGQIHSSGQSGPAGQMGSKDPNQDKGKGHDKEKGKDKEKDREKEKSKSKDKENGGDNEGEDD